MKIGGLQKFSLLDYPGFLSAIVFTKGCNFRCQYCYNPMLVWPREAPGEFKNTDSQKKSEKKEKGHPDLNEDVLFNFLKKRKNKLDAVVISGGEPTVHGDLPEFIAKIKQLGFKIKLDTNGTNPRMLKGLIGQGLVDYLAIDFKAPEKKYARITGCRTDVNKIKESIELAKQSGLPYEIRTTVVPGLLEAADIKEMGEMIAGVEKWYLQRFKSDTELVNNSFRSNPSYSDSELAEFCRLAGKYAGECLVR